jgi:MFS family permease
MRDHSGAENKDALERAPQQADVAHVTGAPPLLPPLGATSAEPMTPQAAALQTGALVPSELQSPDARMSDRITFAVQTSERTFAEGQIPDAQTRNAETREREAGKMGAGETGTVETETGVTELDETETVERVTGEAGTAAVQLVAEQRAAGQTGLAAPQASVPSAPAPSAPAPAPATSAPAAPVPHTRPRAAAYLLAGVLIAVTQALGSSLISANIPYISGQIGGTQIEASWLVAAYMAPRASLSLLLIKIRTQYGLRNFAEVSVVAYVLALLLSLLMRDLPSAITVEFISGIAAAPMSSLAFLYCLEAFSPQRKLTFGLAIALTLITLGSPLARFVSPGLIDSGLPHVLTYLSLGLALPSMAMVMRLPLTSPPRAKVISLLDLISYGLLAIGMGGLTVAFLEGASYWWLEASWIGIVLAVSFAALVAAATIEWHRAAPLIDVRWIASPAILHFSAVLLVFRLILSEQTSGAPGLFRQLGLSPQEMQPLFGVIIAATLAGGLCCACVMKPGRDSILHIIALVLISGGAYADSHATVLTRPEQMYLTQAVIAFAGALFLPPAMMTGLMSALAKGPNYILSFIIVFLTTQSIGGALGSAAFSSFIQIREKLHLGLLTDGLQLTDPMLVARITTLSTQLAGKIPDPAIRKAQAVSTIASDTASQAYVMAYNDAFTLIAALALAALGVLLMHLLLRWAWARRTTSLLQPA